MWLRITQFRETLAPEAASAALSADPDLDPASEALTADAPAEPAGFDPPEPLTSASEDELTLAKGKSKSKSKSKAKVKLVSSTRSFAKDVQGTVEGLEDPDGTSDKNERYALDPYGALENENQLSAEAKANPVRFQGFTYDSASDLYDMQARHYRPEVGRFLTRDRYESSALDVNLEQDPLTNNMYAFAGGNPVSNVEFDGHHICDVSARKTDATRPRSSSRRVRWQSSPHVANRDRDIEQSNSLCPLSSFVYECSWHISYGTRCLRLGCRFTA